MIFLVFSYRDKQPDPFHVAVVLLLMNFAKTLLNWGNGGSTGCGFRAILPIMTNLE